MFELAVLYIIFNMATSNINKMWKYNKKRSPQLSLWLKKLEQFYWPCYAIFLKKLTFLLSVGSNNERKSKVTLKLTLIKFNFNGPNVNLTEYSLNFVFLDELFIAKNYISFRFVFA